jgi:hypothetical protein
MSIIYKLKVQNKRQLFDDVIEILASRQTVDVTKQFVRLFIGTFEHIDGGFSYIIKTLYDLTGVNKTSLLLCTTSYSKYNSLFWSGIPDDILVECIKNREKLKDIPERSSERVPDQEDDLDEDEEDVDADF